MRLVQTSGPNLFPEELGDDNVPDYAILSHTWSDAELEFSDLPATSERVRSKSGCVKVFKFCEIAHQRGFRYGWVDTCCINKTSTTELSEAINSMYRWYARASVCIAYLADVEDLEGFAKSRWFKRGWTLQELVAPKEVEFFDKRWQFIGTKSSLNTLISSITGIPRRIIDGESPSSCSVAQRMSWAAGRETSRVEDRAYSLLGLFDISMPLVYGTTTARSAFLLLQEEIIKHSDDQTILAWAGGFDGTTRGHHGYLADSPDAFAGCQNVVRSHTSSNLNLDGWGITNVGLPLKCLTIPYYMRTYLALLDCTDVRYPHCRYGIVVELLEDGRQYARVQIAGVSRRLLQPSALCKARRICIRQCPGPAVNHRYGFHINKVSLPGRADKESRRVVDIWSHNNIAKPSPDKYFLELLPSINHHAIRYAGNIGFPARDRRVFDSVATNPIQLRTLKFGFDDDFNIWVHIEMVATRYVPSWRCRVSVEDRAQYHDLHRLPDGGTANDSFLASYGTMNNSTCMPESDEAASVEHGDHLTGSEEHHNARNCHYSFKMSASAKATVRFLYTDRECEPIQERGIGLVRVQMSLQPCPPSDQVAPCRESSTWSIWTVDIEEHEELCPINHEEAVTFGLAEPCSTTVDFEDTPTIWQRLTHSWLYLFSILLIFSITVILCLI